MAVSKESVTRPRKPRLNRQRSGLITVPWVIGSEIIVCPEPFCGRAETHPIKVTVNRGGSITTVSHEGTRIGDGEASRWGVLIAVHLQCESGHVFAMRQQFHKGSTIFEVESLGDLSVQTDDEFINAGHVIWRD